LPHDSLVKFSSDLFLESTEYGSTGFAAWFDASACQHFEEFPHDGTFDLQSSDGRCDLPDVVEGNTGEVTAPAGSNRDSADGGDDEVAESLPEVEAFVGVLPDAVNGVGVIGLS